MKPRIPPVSLDDVDEPTREMLGALSRLRDGDVRLLNVFATMGQHPDLMRRWLRFANHVLLSSTLSPRDRELAILRAGWRCHSPYEWGQHVHVGRAAGLSDVEIARVAEGADAEGWTEIEAAIIRAADELHDTSTISDATWKTLAAHYSTEQCMDLVFAIGQYHLVSFALNAFGVERDDGLESSGLPFPNPA